MFLERANPEKLGARKENQVDLGKAKKNS